jgi:hypothetical protein
MGWRGSGQLGVEDVWLVACSHARGRPAENFEIDPTHAERNCQPC